MFRLLPLPIFVGMWAGLHQLFAWWTLGVAISLWLALRTTSPRAWLACCLALFACFYGQSIFLSSWQRSVPVVEQIDPVYLTAKVAAVAPTSDGRLRLLLQPLLAPLGFPDCILGHVEPEARFRLNSVHWFKVQGANFDSVCPFVKLTAEPLTDGQLLEVETGGNEATLLRRTLTRGERPSGLEAKTAFEPIQSAGLGHLLAISGLHLTLIATIVFQFSRMLLRLVPWRVLRRPWWVAHSYKLPWAVVLPACYGFVQYVGAPPSALRAFAMVSIYAVIRLSIRRFIAYDQVLLLACAACIVVYGEHSTTLSFALSMTAMCWFAPLALLPPRWRILGGAILPWLGTAPLVATFGVGNLAAPLANLAGIPLFSGWVFPLAWLSWLAEGTGLQAMAIIVYDAYAYGVWLLWQWAAVCNVLGETMPSTPQTQLFIADIYLGWALLPVMATLWLQRLVFRKRPYAG